MNNEVVLITGGATGIGAAVARLAASEGARVAICDVNDSDGSSLAEELNGRFIDCDVTDAQSVASAVKECGRELGTPKYAHLNAGVMTVAPSSPFLPIESVSEDQFQRIVGVNVAGPYHGLKYLIPEMRREGGAITMTASMVGLAAAPFDPMYTATKYAVIGLGRAVAAANDGTNLRVNVICPGGVATQIVPDELKRESGMMTPKVMALEVIDLLQRGRNGEVRVKVTEDEPAFSAEAMDLMVSSRT